jgi:MYXO-CTERM domain-containing protein
MNHLRLAFVVALLSLGIAPSLAHADVVPPAEDACRVGGAGYRAVGTACSVTGTAGVCRDSTCSRLDYASWNRDASASPPSVDYACVTCVAESPAAADKSTCAVGTAGRAQGGVFGAFAVLAGVAALVFVSRRRR